MATPKKKTTKKKVTKKKATTTNVTRKDAPDKGATRAEGRPNKKYRSLSSYRDILHVRNGDPEKVYRWFKSDEGEGGQRLADAIDAGWEFVDATAEKLGIGGAYVGKSDQFGSLYTRNAGKSSRSKLFLMWYPKWAFEEYVDKPKAQVIDDKEHAILHPEEYDGQYGTVKSDSKLGTGKHTGH
jgi:hypothetical protein